MHGTIAEPQSSSSQPVEVQPDHSHLEALTSLECLAIMDLFHGGGISKVVAILQIQLHLDKEDSDFEESLG